MSEIETHQSDRRGISNYVTFESLSNQNMLSTPQSIKTNSI